jgi:hypothetical protein
VGNIFGECHAACTIKDLFCIHIVYTTKDLIFCPYSTLCTFLWQSKVVDLVDPSFPSLTWLTHPFPHFYMYSFYILLICATDPGSFKLTDISYRLRFSFVSFACIVRSFSVRFQFVCISFV